VATARLLPDALQFSWRSDHELVAAVRRGEDSAFAQLYSRYRMPIWSYASGILRDGDRAEDVSQEVFITVLRRLRDTERPIAFKPWIYQIARNACIDELRRARRSQQVPFEPESAAGNDGDDLRSIAPGPDAAVETKQQLEDLRGAFRALSEPHHRILVLRELEGLSYREVGTRLGMSRPVVESTLFRARRRLAEEYGELISGRRCEHTRAMIDGWEGTTLPRLGVRENRQLARHLAHCQPCRRHAVLARALSAISRPAGAVSRPARAALPEPAGVPPERTSERTSERTLERTSERALGRASERTSEQPIPLASRRRPAAGGTPLAPRGSGSLAVA
jgi:RNA polymerase sigma factor (sigma-70 family)